MITLTHFEESVETFHQRDFSHVDEPQIWVPTLKDTDTLVLGSRQSLDIVDLDACEQRGIDVVRRRSGGGAVLVGRDQLVWFDVLLTQDHPGFSNDVGISFRWVGQRLNAMLASLGITGVSYEGPMVNTNWSELICFAGLGPGEITVGGQKLVGISQRRTRNVARYQVAILRRWQPGEMLELFALSPEMRRRGAHQTATAATATSLKPDQILRAGAAALGAF